MKLKLLVTLFILSLSSETPASSAKCFLNSINDSLKNNKKTQALEAYRKILPRSFSPKEADIEVQRMSRLIDETPNEKLSFDRAFKKICKYYETGDKGDLSFQPRMMTKKTASNVRRALNGGLCLGSLVTAPQVTLAFREWRKEQREKGNHSWIVERGSNYINGLRYLLLADTCSKAIAGNKVNHNLILALALGGNIAGNFWEEVQMFGDVQKSLPIFSSRGRVVSTDWGDFRSGLYATASYFLMIKAFESKLKLPFSKICH